MKFNKLLSTVSIGDKFILEQGNAFFFKPLECGFKPILLEVTNLDRYSRIEFKIVNRDYWQIMDENIFRTISIIPLSSTGKLLYNVE